MNNIRSPNKGPLNAMFFLCVISVSVFLTTAQESSNDLQEFTKWLEDHGSKFRFSFRRNNEKENDEGDVEVIAERRIHDRESVFMLPHTLLINSTVIDR